MSHCGFWLRKVELQLLAARKRPLENEAKCWRLTRECLLAIKRLDEKIEEMKPSETASGGSVAKLELRLRNPRQSQTRGCGKR
ncbi:MAG: hypothetical protein DRJ18_00115 [Candidatus Methanomethylicota archaeon]|nr:MAG: hypothetical protein DRJ18_00115 [Candidatus Verstraetearchaeota archaeon]